MMWLTRTAATTCGDNISYLHSSNDISNLWAQCKAFICSLKVHTHANGCVKRRKRHLARLAIVGTVQCTCWSLTSKKNNFKKTCWPQVFMLPKWDMIKVWKKSWITDSGHPNHVPMDCAKAKDKVTPPYIHSHQ